MKRPRGAENFLHRPLSMSTSTVRAGLWKHPAPSRQPLAAALLGCTGWQRHTQQKVSAHDSGLVYLTVPVPGPGHWSCIFIPLWLCAACLCLRVCVDCVSSGMKHAKVCVSLRRQISLQPGLPLAPYCSSPGDIYRTAGRGDIRGIFSIICDFGRCCSPTCVRNGKTNGVETTIWSFRWSGYVKTRDFFSFKF